MAKQNINVGTTANDKKGDSLRAAFQKVNANFTELYTALGINADVNLNIGAFEFAGSVMSTTDSTAIVIDQATTITSNLSVGGDILPQTAHGGDLGSSTLPWRSLYVSNNTIYIGGVAIGLDASNNLTVSGSRVGTTSYADLSGKPALTTVATTGAYADLTGKPTIPTLVSQLSNDSGFLTSVGNISNIQSEGNINIEVNLSDSTKRIWQFGEDGDLILPAGGDIKNSTGTSVLGGSVSSLVNGAYTASLGNTGALTLPAGGVISEGGGLSGAIKLTPAGGANANQALLIYPTGFAEGDHIHLTAGGGSTELYLGDDDHYVKLASNGFVVIKADDGVSGKVWGFSPDGTTSIPGDIKSDGNINIDINLTDSTLRRWQFGEDGNLTLPAGGDILNSSGQPYVNGLTSISTSVSTGIFSDASGDYQYGTLDYSYAVNGNAGQFSIEYSRPLVGGNVDINVGNTIVNGDLTLSGNIKSNSNINIDINLADSTLRRWQFGEDGDTVFPNNISIDYGGGNNVQYPRIIADSGKSFSVQGQGETGSAALAWSVDPESAGQYAQIGATKGGGDNLAKVVIQAQSNSGDGNTAKIWKFDETGALTIPGDIRSEGNINIDINLTDSTLRRWQFGEDGILTVPGPISGLGNAKLDFTTYGANVAYLTSTSNDTTALYMGSVSAELYAHTNILIRTNTDGTAKVWTFGDDGSLTTPGNITLPNGSVIKDTDWLAVAFGSGAGTISQGFYAVAVGQGAGYNGQGNAAVAIGSDAGGTSQGLNAVAVGAGAGYTGQGINAVAIGIQAGYTNQAANSIIINATGATLNQTTANTFTVAPIRNISATSGVLQYNDSTKEVSYSNSVTAETFNTDQITVVGNRITTTVTNANLELECNGSGGVVINTLAEATTASTARSAGYLGIPASAVSTTNTLTIADAGEHIYVTTNSQTITIPANASVAYPIGTTLTFIAGPSATTVTIAITSDTLRLAGGTSTGTRTLAANGMATAVKVAATTWYINGTGLT